MEVEPIWYKYATFDDDGYVNGIMADAPDEAKAAYREYLDELQRYKDERKPIPR